MDTKYDFILTNDTKLVNKKKNLFFLKKIYSLKINDDLPKDYDKNIFNPLPYSREQIIQDYEFCEQVFQSIFNDLVVILNFLNTGSTDPRNTFMNSFQGTGCSITITRAILIGIAPLAHLRKQIRDNVVTALTGLSTTGGRC